MPGGRPSKYKPEYCEDIIDFTTDGLGLTCFAAEIGVSRDTLNEWSRVHPEFSDALKIAKTRAASWWEKGFRQCAMSGVGNPTPFIFALKNLDPDSWRDKQEVAHSGGMALQVSRVVLAGPDQ